MPLLVDRERVAPVTTRAVRAMMLMTAPSSFQVSHANKPPEPRMLKSQRWLIEIISESAGIRRRIFLHVELVIRSRNRVNPE